MRVGHKTFIVRVALLALVVVGIGLVAGAAVARAENTFYVGTTYGHAMNKTAPIGCDMTITASTPSVINVAFTSAADSGFYAYALNTGPLPTYYSDLTLSAMKDEFVTISTGIEANPGNFVVTNLTLNAEGTTFTGKIRNSKTGKALFKAKVTLLGHTVTTKRSGMYTFSNFSVWPGLKVSIKVSKSGYHTKTVKVLPNPGGTVTRNISLTHK